MTTNCWPPENSKTTRREDFLQSVENPPGRAIMANYLPTGDVAMKTLLIPVCLFVLILPQLGCKTENVPPEDVTSENPPSDPDATGKPYVHRTPVLDPDAETATALPRRESSPTPPADDSPREDAEVETDAVETDAAETGDAETDAAETGDAETDDAETGDTDGADG
jgi:hypothetical protein